MKINSLVHNTIAVCLCLLVFIIAFVWIAFHFNDSTSAFKDALDIGASFFSAIATLAAAYIASILFNDWREQHNKNIEAQLCLKAYDHMQATNFKLISIQRMTIDFLCTEIDKRDFDTFDTNLETLEILADETAIVLADLGFLMTPSEFDKNFKPIFEAFIKDFEDYISVYKGTFKNMEKKERESSFIETYDVLGKNLIQSYRKIYAELNTYYKAI